MKSSMKKIRNLVLIFVGVFILLVFILPLFWPIHPLENIKPVEDLSLQSSQFVHLKGINVHYTDSVEGERAIVLLHGFGSWLYTWNEIVDSLSEYGRIIAYDRPAFGLTARLLPEDWKDGNPYLLDKQPDLLVSLLDSLGIQKVILVGNSAGGTVALMTALQYPERVKALVLVDAAILNSGGSPILFRLLASIPTINRIGPLLVRNIQNWGRDLISTAWHKPENISDDRIEAYKIPLKMENWDVGLWELTKSTKSLNLANSLARIDIPVLVISGDDDRIIPISQSVELAGLINNSKLSIISDCGHVPQEECPQAFLEIIIPFIESIQ